MNLAKFKPGPYDHSKENLYEAIGLGDLMDHFETPGDLLLHLDEMNDELFYRVTSVFILHVIEATLDGISFENDTLLFLLGALFLGESSRYSELVERIEDVLRKINDRTIILKLMDKIVKQTLPIVTQKKSGPLSMN